jgi:5-formyltetrahydrofolate cyclo-ligase
MNFEEQAMGSDRDKTALRTRTDADVDALGPDERRRQALAMVEALDRWLSNHPAEVILATLPLAHEADLTPVLARWLARGKAVALARTGPDRSLDFGVVDSLEGPWEPRPFGLREPHRSAPGWVAGRPTLCLVPGVAFGFHGGTVARLGRGAGYYDRWLAVHGGEVFTLGFGFSVQWIDHVPVEDHDQPLQAWLGPDGVVSGSEARTLTPSQNTEKIS